MSEREDVEALAEELKTHADSYEPVSGGHAYSGYAGAILASSWLAAHDERVRAEAWEEIEERCRYLAFGTPAPGVLVIVRDILAVLPPERLAGEAGAR